MIRLEMLRALALLGLTLASCSAREQVVRDETRISVRAERGPRSTTAPVATIPELPDITRAQDLALGDDGTRCVRLDDGSVWCWSESDRDRIPTRVEGIDESVRLWGDASAYCSMNASGRVMCWGRVGIDADSRNPTLLAVPRPIHVALGTNGGCAVVEDGSVRCWGHVWSGPTPRHAGSIGAQPGLSDVISLDAHGLSRCAVTRAHEVLCWGWQAYDHLGVRRDDGYLEHREARGAEAVTLTHEGVWWIARDGRVRTMVRGRHDDRLRRYVYDAVDVRGVQDVIALASEGSSVCGVTREGAVWCWRANLREARVQPITGATAIVANETNDICVRNEAGWHCRRERDRDEWEPLAWGPRQERAPAGAAVAEAGPVCGFGPDRVAVEELAAGYGHFCARLADGNVRCWGLNGSGQTGGPMSGDRVRQRLAGVPRPATAIAAGQHFSCAITDDGSMWCWGENGHGELGRGDRRDSDTPVEVGLRGRVVAMALGTTHACARTENGQLWCWGSNDRGELGDGTSTLRTAPVRVSALRAVGAIAAGPGESCAVDRGAVMCWGGSRGAAPPHAIEGVDGAAVSALVVAEGASCALLHEGSVWCWGSGAEGQLGPAEAVESARAVRIEGIPAVRRLAAYRTEICAVGTDASAWCWGRPSQRRVAQRRGGRPVELPPPSIPRRAEWIDQVVSIAPGYDEICAAQQSGGVCCWAADPQPRTMTW